MDSSISVAPVLVEPSEDDLVGARLPGYRVDELTIPEGETRSLGDQQAERLAPRSELTRDGHDRPVNRCLRPDFLGTLARQLRATELALDDLQDVVGPGFHDPSTSTHSVAPRRFLGK